MAFVDDPNSNSEGTQVAGAAPLSNEAPAQGSSDPGQSNMGGSQPSTIQSGSPTPSTNKKAKKASSGMFTNIQKYVEKNKPQAQNMATAVTQDVSKQADQIRQAVDAQKEQKSQALQSNQQVIQQGTDWAQQQVSNIMNPAQAAAPVAAPTEADTSRFQELMQGNVQGLQNVGNLNVSEQTAKTQALQNLAQSADTEQGRKNLLGQTFSKQGKYDRGMAGLDQLITSGDQAARESLIQGTQERTGELQGNIQNILSQYKDQKAAQDLAAKNIGGDVQGFQETASSGIQSAAEAEQQRRLSEFGNEQIAFEDALASGNVTAEQLDQFIGEDTYNQLVSDAQNRQKTFADYIDGSQRYKTLEQDRRFADIAGLDKDEVQRRQAEFIAEATKDIGMKKRPSHMPESEWKQSISHQKYITGLQAKKDFQKQLSGQITSQKIDKSSIQKKLQELATKGQLSQYLTGPSARSLQNVQNAATPEQVAKYQALAKLAGKDTMWNPDTVANAPTTRGKIDTARIKDLLSNLIKV